MSDYENATPLDRWRFQTGASELVRLAWQYVIPIRIARIDESREVGYNTATGFVILVDHEYLVGTAWHVFNEYLRRKAQGEDLILLANDVPLEPPVVGWQDEDNDIVFLRVSETLVAQAGALPYEPGFRWPPRRITTDDVAFFCGFPKCLRGDGHPTEIEFGNVSLMLSVASVSESHFVLQIDRATMIDAGRVTFPAQGTALGGISGSPVFVMDTLSYPLVGIVSQMAESLDLIYVKSLAHAPPTMRPSARAL